MFCSLYSCIEGSALWCLGVNSFVLWAELVWFTVNCTEMVSAPTLGIGGSQNGRLVGDDVLSLVICMCISSQPAATGVAMKTITGTDISFTILCTFFRSQKCSITACNCEISTLRQGCPFSPRPTEGGWRHRMMLLAISGTHLGTADRRSSTVWRHVMGPGGPLRFGECEHRTCSMGI